MEQVRQSRLKTLWANEHMNSKPKTYTYGRLQRNYVGKTTDEGPLATHRNIKPKACKAYKEFCGRFK